MKTLGNIALGFLVTAAMVSLVVGGFLLGKNILSDYEFNLRNATISVLILVAGYLFNEIGKVTKEYLQEVKNDIAKNS